MTAPPLGFGLIVGHGELQDAGSIAAVVQAAEERGFTSLWVPEHVFVPIDHDSAYPYRANGQMPAGADANFPSPLLWLTVAATATNSIRLGTACLIAPLWNPFVLARAAATLDAISGGRVDLGLGLGWLTEEVATAAGAAALADPTASLAESVALMRRLWSDDPTIRSPGTGAPVTGHANPRPAAGSVPIHIAGPSVAAARRAGEFGDGYLTHSAGGAPLELRLAALREAAEGETRTISVACAPNPRTIDGLLDLGVDRLMFVLGPIDDLDATRHRLDRLSTQAGDSAR